MQPPPRKPAYNERSRPPKTRWRRVPGENDKSLGQRRIAEINMPPPRSVLCACSSSLTVAIRRRAAAAVSVPGAVLPAAVPLLIKGMIGGPPDDETPSCMAHRIRFGGLPLSPCVHCVRCAVHVIRGRRFVTLDYAHPEVDSAVGATRSLDQSYVYLLLRDQPPAHVHERRVGTGDEREATVWPRRARSSHRTFC